MEPTRRHTKYNRVVPSPSTVLCSGQGPNSLHADWERYHKAGRSLQQCRAESLKRYMVYAGEYELDDSRSHSRMRAGANLAHSQVALEQRGNRLCAVSAV